MGLTLIQEVPFVCVVVCKEAGYGFDPIRGCSGVEVRTAETNGHRLTFEVSKLEGDQHDDRT
ncbi:hypothetical protein [Streptomyces sp. NPDC048665]|uniref:hypothetical protein n=1 Tax=Streptomyces sp. NPDC048665 TaxID=3155490 RepID=UPI00341A4BC3